MKKFAAICLAAFGFAISAEVTNNLAVKFYGTNAAGIPTNWPAEIRELKSATNPPPGFVLMTVQEFQAYKTANQSEYNAWTASQQATNDSARSANIAALASLFDDFLTAENNWTNLSQAQQIGILRKHNQALLRLKPLIQDLYLDRLKTQ